MKFADAGAGLPNIERLFIQFILIPFVRVVMGWDIARLLIKREIKIIKKLLKNIPTKKLQQKMSIDRTFAIEDNSRQFSIYDVLEHLVITGLLVKDVITHLSLEQKVKYDIKIEDVKPKENKANQLEYFLIFYNDYDTFIKKLPKKQSNTTKAHPWFVKFNNFDWNIFMFMHTFIHRRQIQAILQTQNNPTINSNTIKTIIIAGLLLAVLLFSWFLLATFIYLIFITIFNLSFSWFYALMVLLIIIIARIIIPKNVFM